MSAAPSFEATPAQDELQRVEFTPEQERGIRASGRWMWVAALTTFVSSVLGGCKLAAHMLWGAPTDQLTTVSNVVGAVVGLVLATVLAIWLVKGSGALRRVVETDDDDQAQLMHALDELRRIFALKVITILATIGVVCVAFVIGVIIAVAS